MGIFRRSGGAQQVIATITAAGAPPQNLTGRHYGDWVFVVADLGHGPTLLRSVIQLDRDRWLVPGLRILIEIDPKNVNSVNAFTINWGTVATIKERVIAGDPSLTDPRTARRRAHDIQSNAQDPTPNGIDENTVAPSSGFATDTCPWSADFDAAVERAALLPAPAGQQRAVVVIAAMRMVFRNIGHHPDGRPNLFGDGATFQAAYEGNETVLAVTVPGQPAYAVFQAAFHSPADKPVTANPNRYPWLPAFVSLSDPNNVEILWDEVPDATGWPEPGSFTASSRSGTADS